MSQVIPTPLSRWSFGVGEDGGTLTVQRVARHGRLSAIRKPWVECWVAGELVRLPLDERWGTGLQPITDESRFAPVPLTREQLATALADWMTEELASDLPAMSDEGFKQLAAEAVAFITERPA